MRIFLFGRCKKKGLLFIAQVFLFTRIATSNFRVCIVVIYLNSCVHRKEKLIYEGPYFSVIYFSPLPIFFYPSFPSAPSHFISRALLKSCCCCCCCCFLFNQNLKTLDTQRPSRQADPLRTLASLCEKDLVSDNISKLNYFSKRHAHIP